MPKLGRSARAHPQGLAVEKPLAMQWSFGFVSLEVVFPVVLPCNFEHARPLTRRYFGHKHSYNWAFVDFGPPSTCAKSMSQFNFSESPRKQLGISWASTITIIDGITGKLTSQEALPSTLHPLVTANR